MELESHTLQLMGVYRSIYNRLVRPDVTLPVRDYFLTRWAHGWGAICHCSSSSFAASA